MSSINLFNQMRKLAIVKNAELKNDDRFRKMKHDRKNMRKRSAKLYFALVNDQF